MYPENKARKASIYYHFFLLENNFSNVVLFIHTSHSIAILCISSMVYEIISLSSFQNYILFAFCVDIPYIVLYNILNINGKKVKHMQIVIKDNSYKPLLSTIDLFSGLQSLIYDIIDSMIDEVYYSLGSLVHSVCHWLMYHFIRRKEQITCNNTHAIIAAIIYSPCVTPQNRIFFNISHKIRNVYLLRPRSRGCDDDFSLVVLSNTR